MPNEERSRDRDERGVILALDLESGEEVARFEGDSSVTGLDLDTNGTLLAASFADGTSALYELTTGARRWAVLVREDGAYLVTRGNEHPVGASGDTVLACTIVVAGRGVAADEFGATMLRSTALGGTTPRVVVVARRGSCAGDRSGSLPMAGASAGEETRPPPPRGPASGLTVHGIVHDLWPTLCAIGGRRAAAYAALGTVVYVLTE